MDCNRLSYKPHWLLLCALLMIAQAKEDNTQALVTTINRLGLDLHRVVSRGNLNMMSSPYSLTVMLGILYEGAAGYTRQQMADVLGFSKNTDISKIFRELRLSMSCKQNENCPVVEANGIFPSITVTILSEFIEIVQGQMGAELLPMNFANAASVGTMNEWVSNKTSDLIKNLIDPNEVDPSTVLILINAIYLKADWKEPFSAHDKEIHNFYLEDGKTVSCPMMKQTSLSTNVGKSVFLDALIVEIPCIVDELSMYILLPNKFAGLQLLEDKINEAMIDDLIERMDEKHVELVMPKFNMSNSLEMTETLIKLGLKDMISGPGNFSRISPADIFITKFVQKSYIRVDEQGIEAAAATMVIMTRSRHPHDMYIVINHPFLFFIRHKPSGIILLLGRVANPQPNSDTQDDFRGLGNSSITLEPCYELIMSLLLAFSFSV